MNKKIEEIFAFISEEENGSEGVLGVKLGDTYYPLIGADMDRIESLRSSAIQIGKKTNQPIRLLKFKLVSDEVVK